MTDFAFRDNCFISTSAEATERFAESLAGMLRPGDVISLSGDLGAGKTTLTRGLARGLGCRGHVASPTFTLLMEYPAGETKIALYHFDVYRLDSPAAFLELGFADYLNGEGICVIEWGQKIKDLLPAGTIFLRLGFLGEEQREICLDGQVSPTFLAELKQRVLARTDRTEREDNNADLSL